MRHAGTRKARRTVLWGLLLAAGIGALGGRPVPAGAKGPVDVILDTDIGPDVDDVGSVALLHGLANRGEAHILGMFCCTSNPWGAPCLDALNTYFGRPEIPIGTLKAPGFLTGSKYTEAVAKQFPNDLRSGDNAPDATTLYRKLLAHQRKHSVVLCATGPLVNLKRLLESGPDEHSKLDGRALVAEKVRLLSVMGGRYPEGKEWNFVQDPVAAARVATDWPTPIRFSGWEIGARIHTGARLAQEAPEKSPVRAAYALYVGAGKDRESWDQTAVLAGVRGPGPLWEVRHGTNIVDPNTGDDKWQTSREGRHEYLVEKESIPHTRTAIEDLMLASPAKPPSAGEAAGPRIHTHTRVLEH